MDNNTPLTKYSEAYMKHIDELHTPEELRDELLQRMLYKDIVRKITIALLTKNEKNIEEKKHEIIEWLADFTRYSREEIAKRLNGVKDPTGRETVSIENSFFLESIRDLVTLAEQREAYEEKLLTELRKYTG
jgi:DNA-binding transcriptional ArsR family regulator